jgi:hypothetical protein
MTTHVRRTIGAFAMVAAIVAACSTMPGATSPSSAPSPAGSVPSGSSAAGLPDGFPIGSWTTTITEADLLAGGITDEGDLIENAGVFTTTFAEDGTWTTTQDTDATVKWPVFRGTWTATSADTISQRTDFPGDFAGDVVDFTWKIEGGDLLLKVVNPPDQTMPVVVETHPWKPAR